MSVEEPMRVAPDGHVIELKLGETATGALAEYLVASRCNVTVVEADDALDEEAAPATTKAPVPKAVKTGKTTAK